MRFSEAFFDMKALTEAGAKVVWEHSASMEAVEIPDLRLVSTRKYRDTCLTFYEKL